MASRRSDPNRTVRPSTRTPAAPTGRAPVPTSPQADSAAPGGSADPTAGSAAAQTPSKRPAREHAPPAARRAGRAKAGSARRPGAVTDDLRRAMIAEAAYFHAERRGFAPGGEVQDWLSAEAEVDALLKAAGGVPQ